MSTELWMPLHITRYLMDTKGLDLAQHGAYLLLIMEYWLKGPLPDDDGWLCRVVGVELRTWQRSLAPKLRPFFTSVDGRLHQKRADIELAKAADISTKRRAAAFASHKAPPTGGGGTHSDDHKPNGAKAHANAPTKASVDNRAKAHANAPANGVSKHANAPTKAPAHALHLVPRNQEEVEERKEKEGRFIDSSSSSFSVPAREAVSTGQAPTTEPEPMAHPMEVANVVAKATAKLRNVEYGSAYQPISEDTYREAAVDYLHQRPRPKEQLLVGDALVAFRRAGGMIR